MSRILFLYATRNSGHQKAAEAVKIEIHRILPDVKTFEVDFFTKNYPNLGPFIARMYLEIVRSVPHAWDYLYDSEGFASITRELRQFFAFLNITKIRGVLKEHKPDAIICTQAIPAGFIAAEKAKKKITTPLYITVTDFVANPYWPDNNVDCYFVPDEKIKTDLVRRGIPGNHIRTTGIPINRRFAASVPKPAAKKKMGLKPHNPAVLVMGGTQGIGQISEASDILSTRFKTAQLVIVAGHNNYLHNTLRKKYHSNKSIHVLGHAANVSRLMDAADILITKPGGITSAEAMSKGLPMIILSPLPGQEERNAEFLVKHGIAERCRDITHLPRIVESFLNDPAKTDNFRSQALSHAKPFAASEIADHVAKLLNR
ncbi:MAG: glycosyltransferase [Endomicrobiales bacterium]|nr:glycosyltransferase [Endomicrobiales bacterium]